MNFLPWEELELRALVEGAWELRSSPVTPEYRAALEAIDAWRDRRFLARYRRLQAEQTEWLVELLRETDPARIERKAAA